MGIANGLCTRMIACCRGLVQMVPPDLACCEFECRAVTCSAKRFDACNKRLEYVELTLQMTDEGILCHRVPKALLH